MARKMNSKNSNNSASVLNFRPQLETRQNEKKGNKPLPEPSSISHILLLVLIHICKKVLYVDPSIKVGIYIIFVFFGSILGDVLPIPHSYFSRKGNFFNLYFVKLSWAWTMGFVGLFVWLTSIVYSCGNKSKAYKHIIRLTVATCLWFIWTTFFDHVEENYGYCTKSANGISKKQCLLKGQSWHGFSISGHAFILIYCALIIMEEAKALMGWEAISDHIRNEEHNRVSTDTGNQTPLDSLSREQFLLLKEKYNSYTPMIKVIFICMTCLTVLWDVMLVATILYFHNTPEKFIGSMIAVLMWFFTYRFIFFRRVLGIPLPGNGDFQYMQLVQPSYTSGRRSSLPGGKVEKGPIFPSMSSNAAKGAFLVGSGAVKVTERSHR